MAKLTPHGFEHEVRGKLLDRGFDHDQLGKLRSAYDHALVESGRHEFERGHFDEMWGHMEGHPALKNLSEKKLETVKSVLKNHLGIKDEQPSEEEIEAA